jgi:hypothetical protein
MIIALLITMNNATTIKIKYGAFCELNYCFNGGDCEINSEDPDHVSMRLKRDQNTELLVRDRSNLLNKSCSVHVDGEKPAWYCIHDITPEKNSLNLHCRLEEK